MRTLKLLTLSIVATALSASAASAQACLGLPSFANGSVHVNAGGEFYEDATTYAAGIGAGRPNNLFANLGGGQTAFEAIDGAPEGKTKFGFLEFGYQFPLATAQFCPIAGGYFSAGPDDDATGQKVTTYGATAGFALGLPIDVGSFRVIPNAGVQYQMGSQKVEFDDVEASNDSFDEGTLNLGLALVFGDRFSIQPLAHIPVGADEGARTNFGVFASVSFGWISR
ncbi:MAG: hypothetical protein ACREMQ_05415 [Longimicrobiales bacterium]